MKITGISLWGDSIGKGIVYDAQRGRYSIYADNLFSMLKRSLTIPVDNYALMGCTAPAGPSACAAHSCARAAWR